ncbi:tetratricopeptide repeat protein [Microbacterium sp. NPDC055910]|uniref:tetratricopeptide repeat protein n=1 Tax=Microbacterium sp. NPDC055910 TaxID=3345659 RepID=UPI0035E36B2F
MITPPLRIDDVPEQLRAMRAQAGEPSYAEIARRVTAQRAARGAASVVSRATVYDCFREGRKRFDVELVLAIVRALAPAEATVSAWTAALAALGQRTAAAGLVTVTDELPAAVAPFVGRTRELALLTRGTSAHWIHAMPGAGKTTLAMQAARTARASGHVGGVIVVDLRGHSPVGPPAAPHAIVRAVLRHLGDKNNGLSVTAARRQLRDRLRATRTMLLLDDAASLEQVEAIVPHPAGVSVIVTSRIVPRSTTFRPLELALFAPYESLALLDAVAGRATIERDPAAAEALLQLTDHQPLAVSITAARVAARDTWTLAEHLELARTRRANLRLDEPVSRSLDLTYGLLPDSAQRLLRALAAHPVELLDRESIVAIADAAPDVDADLDLLARHSLIARTGDGRIRMHEAVRIHAVDLGLEVDPSSQRRAAADRLRQSVVSRAWAAHAARSRSRRAPGRAPRWPVGEVELTAREAEAFFADAIDLLLHIALEASADETSPTVTLIAETIDDALHRAGRADDAVGLFREALRVARAGGDREGELRALVDVGSTLTLTGRAAEAEAMLSSIDREAPGWPLEAPLVGNALGASLLAQGRFAEARASFEGGLVAARAAGDLWREGMLWNNIALLHLHTGELDEARTALGRSIEISTQCGDASAAARGRVNLAKLLLDLGDDSAAETQARQALADMQELEHVPGVVVAYSNLAAAVCALGRFDECAEIAEAGLAVAREAGMKRSEFELLRTIGASLLGEGRLGEAREAFERARILIESIGDRLGVAEVAEDLGDCAHAANDIAEARRRWQEAVDEHAAIDSPWGAEVRDKLESLLAPRT